MSSSWLARIHTIFNLQQLLCFRLLSHLEADSCNPYSLSFVHHLTSMFSLSLFDGEADCYPIMQTPEMVYIDQRLHYSIAA